MQAKLPDVNGGIVRHRNGAMMAYDQGDYVKAAISLNNIIALLPDDYKVTINTQAYEQATKARHIIACRYCKVDEVVDEKATGEKTASTFEMQNITKYPLYLSNIDSLISGQKTLLVWKCPTCEEVQPIADSDTQTIKFQKPYYLGIIPELPIRHGLHDRVGFHEKFQVWYSIAFAEIEKMVADYRRDYSLQNPDADLDKYEHLMDKDEDLQ